MGRKKKLVESEQTVAVHEDKAPNGSSETESGVEKLHLHPQNSAMNVKDHVHQICNAMKKYERKSRVECSIVRRSNRIRSLVLPVDRLRAEPVVEHVNLVEDEKEQEAEIPQVRVEPQVNGRNLEEKVEYLVRTADEFKSKVLRGQDEGGPCPEISYKSLYLDSQKKIEALMEENYGLVRKLEFARGKIAAYEVMKNVVGGPKEVMLVSTDIAARLSPPAPAAAAANDPKPKKTYTYKKKARARGADDPKPMQKNNHKRLALG